MVLHELKTDPEPFDDVWSGKKTFEIRFNDRNYCVGDMILLRKTVFTGEEMKYSYNCLPLIYSGKEILAYTRYILPDGYGLKSGWIIIGIEVLEKVDKSQSES